MNIKICKSDKVFSQYVRKTRGKCARCGSLVRFNERGLPISHTLSHYIGRGAEAVRFDEENADVLCFPCHVLWGSVEKDKYREYKISQLGRKGYNALIRRSNQYVSKKKNRESAYIKYKNLLNGHLPRTLSSPSKA